MAVDSEPGHDPANIGYFKFSKEQRGELDRMTGRAGLILSLVSNFIVLQNTAIGECEADHGYWDWHRKLIVELMQGIEEKALHAARILAENIPTLRDQLKKWDEDQEAITLRRGAIHRMEAPNV